MSTDLPAPFDAQERENDRLERFATDPRFLEIQDACERADELDEHLRALLESPRSTAAQIRRADDQLFAAEERAVAALRRLPELVGDTPSAVRSLVTVSDERILAAWEGYQRNTSEAARALGVPLHWVSRAIRRLIGPQRVPGGRHAG